ncbi:chymotrypsin-2-like [Colias croceus]|uniref:chymotrypsin-2-like n=1 Tax=Colias crocea TaxID=72248 RepID=UPI001E27FCCA|nr:chymotrypsin-2-like [Colias croceus]
MEHASLEGATIDPETKVFGGDDAPEGAFPHQVSLRKTTWREYHFCGGSIVRKSWVLTAAHCTINVHPDNITVVAGTNSLDSDDGMRYNLDEIINHENYNQTTLENDIALLRIVGEFDYSSDIAPIALAEQPYTCWYGYYDQVPDQLQVLYLKTVSVEQCREDLSTNGKPNDLPVTDTNVCASKERGAGSCKGDSGGPLAVNKTLIGVVSWGRNICGQGVPEVYASVYEFRNWILENLDSDE